MKSKRFITTMIAVLAITLTTNAQVFMTGNFSLSGNGGKTEYESISEKSDKYTSFGLGVTGGYFLSDNFAVGLGLSYSGDKSKDADDNDTDVSNMFYVNPFVRYYFLQSGNFSLAAQGKVNLGFGGSKYKSGSTTTDGPDKSLIGFSVSPVVEYAVNEHWSITSTLGSLYFNSNTSKTSHTTTHTNSYGLNTSLSSISFGVLYKF